MVLLRHRQRVISAIARGRWIIPKRGGAGSSEPEYPHAGTMTIGAPTGQPTRRGFRTSAEAYGAYVVNAEASGSFQCTASGGTFYWSVSNQGAFADMYLEGFGAFTMPWGASSYEGPCPGGLWEYLDDNLGADRKIWAAYRN